jgi:hypothetical protein
VYIFVHPNSEEVIPKLIAYFQSSIVKLQGSVNVQYFPVKESELSGKEATVTQATLF